MNLAGNEFQIACLELDKANKAIVEPLGLAEHAARIRLMKLIREMIIQADFFTWIEEPHTIPTFDLSPSNPDK